MDLFYNYSGIGQGISTPYGKGSPKGYDVKIDKNVIDPHASDVSYAYRANAIQVAPHQISTFKGYTFNQVPFLFLQDHRKDYKSSLDDAIKGLHTPSALNKIYFSEENITRVQRAITNAVYMATKKKVIIEDQPRLDILLRMESSYYSYGRFLPTEVNAQVEELNYITIKETVPEIITQIKQQLGYIRDISFPRQVMSLPMNVNNAGRQTTRSISSIYEN